MIPGWRALIDPLRRGAAVPGALSGRNAIGPGFFILMEDSFGR